MFGVVMLHKCVRCERLYGDNARELRDGCECGAKVFTLVRDGSGGGEEKASPLKLPGSELGFEVEDIRASEKGVFHVNLDSLMKSKAPVARDENGVYHIRFRNPKNKYAEFLE